MLLLWWFWIAVIRWNKAEMSTQCIDVDMEKYNDLPMTTQFVSIFNGSSRNEWRYKWVEHCDINVFHQSRMNFMITLSVLELLSPQEAWFPCHTCTSNTGRVTTCGNVLWQRLKNQYDVWTWWLLWIMNSKWLLWNSRMRGLWEILLIQLHIFQVGIQSNNL